LKKPDILVSSHDRLRNFSNSSASSESDEDNSVHVMLKQSAIRMAATSDSESEHGVSKLFSAPSLKDSFDRTGATSCDLGTEAAWNVPVLEVSSVLETRYDRLNPFNLSEDMFELSDDNNEY
jgi:hypothetical protein